MSASHDKKGEESKKTDLVSDIQNIVAQMGTNFRAHAAKAGFDTLPAKYKAGAYEKGVYGDSCFKIASNNFKDSISVKLKLPQDKKQKAEEVFLEVDNAMKKAYNDYS